MTGRKAITASVVRARLDALAKPPGSLGRLERLAERLAVTQGTLAPVTRPRQLLLFAGDHGVVEAGVGIWPSSVTAAMMSLIAAGRASSSALAAACDTAVVLVDVGSLAEPGTDARPAGWYDARVRRGTHNLAAGPALTTSEFADALAVGASAARRAMEAGCRVIALGEMGIGNTTPAACLTALLTGATPADVVGRGAGATSDTLARKTAIVEAASTRARGLAQQEPDKVAAMASVAGLEIVAIAGAIAAARAAGVTVILDGFVTGAAALVAAALDPAALDTAIAAHRGAEPGHAIALDHLGLEPYLEWDLRLGEGTGALLLLPLVDAAAALLSNVATLAEVARS